MVTRVRTRKNNNVKGHYMTTDRILIIPGQKALEEYRHLKEICEHVNSQMLPVFKEKGMHPKKEMVLAMCKAPSLFPGDIQQQAVNEGDENLLHYNGKKMIINTYFLQKHFNECYGAI